MDDSPQLCRSCNAVIKPGFKFCTECGTPVENIKEEIDEKKTLTCPQCNTELKESEKFCTECGTKIEALNSENITEEPLTTDTPTEPLTTEMSTEETTKETTTTTEPPTKETTTNEDITNCPKCNATIKPGTKFCTVCGTNILEYKPVNHTPTQIQTGTKITSSPRTSSSPKKDDPMEDLKETGMGLMKDVEKTGRGLMKDLGGFLDKKSKKSSNNTIKPAKKVQKFLVCDKCGGYYELQPGESPEDFSLDCDCGGHLELKNQHP